MRNNVYYQANLLAADSDNNLVGNVPEQLKLAKRNQNNREYMEANSLEDKTEENGNLL